jgi:hypothetical protein
MGYVITLGGNAVVWQSKLQMEIALSTMAAEYVALSTGMRMLTYLRTIYSEMAKGIGLPYDDKSFISTVFEDNQACLILATTDPPRHTPQSRMIAVKYHWFREQLDPKTIVLQKIDGKLQLANILAKALSRELFEQERKMIFGW